MLQNQNGKRIGWLTQQQYEPLYRLPLVEPVCEKLLAEVLLQHETVYRVVGHFPTWEIQTSINAQGAYDVRPGMLVSLLDRLSVCWCYLDLIPVFNIAHLVVAEF